MRRGKIDARAIRAMSGGRINRSNSEFVFQYLRGAVNIRAAKFHLLHALSKLRQYFAMAPEPPGSRVVRMSRRISCGKCSSNSSASWSGGTSASLGVPLAIRIRQTYRVAQRVRPLQWAWGQAAARRARSRPTRQRWRHLRPRGPGDRSPPLRRASPMAQRTIDSRWLKQEGWTWRRQEL